MARLVGARTRRNAIAISVAASRIAVANASSIQSFLWRSTPVKLARYRHLWRTHSCPSRLCSTQGGSVAPHLIGMMHLSLHFRKQALVIAFLVKLLFQTA